MLMAAVAADAASSSMTVAAADGTDSHRRYTGTPGADDSETSSNDDDLAVTAAASRLPKMSGSKEDESSYESVADNDFNDTTDRYEEVEGNSTIMTSETEAVANGFVRDGSSLPYVFETSESGW